MAAFSLTKGGKTFDFDLSGDVSRAGTRIGKWTTSNDDNNNLVVTEDAGAVTSFTAVWKFNTNNQLELRDGNNLLCNFQSQNNILPKYRIENAALQVIPDKNKNFSFLLNGEWKLNEQFDMTVTFGTTTSTIDGYVEDHKSRFNYKFIPKVGTAEIYELTFAGNWMGKNVDGKYIMTFTYDRKGQPRTFSLPQSATFDTSINQLVFDYDKDGLSRRLQFVGELKISSKFVISYKLDQQKSGSGKTLVSSTSLSIQAKLDMSSFKGELSFSLMKTDGVTPGTKLAIAGKFEKDLSGNKLKVAFTYNYEKIGGVVKTNSFTLAGQLKLKNDLTLTWVFDTDIVTRVTTISFEADQFRIGDFMGNVKLSFTTESGQIKEVRMLFGFAF